MLGKPERDRALALRFTVGVVALALGQVRVFANAGVGSLIAGRWNDIDARHPLLPGWIDAGLVSRSGPRGESPPERLAQLCCGNR